ncbi:MAG: hypothetical protein K2X50_03160 [Gammaproteobacteria bacterium]|nr:hypothetical protein [Gammaproteobacteria bacterium]
MLEYSCRSHGNKKTALYGKAKIVLIEDQPQRPGRIETMLMELIRSGTFKMQKTLFYAVF